MLTLALGPPPGSGDAFNPGARKSATTRTAVGPEGKPNRGLPQGPKYTGSKKRQTRDSANFSKTPRASRPWHFERKIHNNQLR